MTSKYTSLKAFYPFYLSQHQNTVCRRLHFVGSLLGLTCLAAAFILQAPYYILLGLVLGYLFAWIGHFVFEKNKPATFQYPLYSFVCDLLIFRDILLRRLPW
ncbi:Mpo1-like protein [Pseudoalteromonas sp.]|uniref:Mpo1-like protein n=1 Tax=Pseudoalteromonas sp. TaxID=53249 RepID=UPI00356AB1A5